MPAPAALCDRSGTLSNLETAAYTCRPAWAALAQQTGESSPACDERLREMFSFSADSAGSVIGLNKATASPKPALKTSARSAPKKKPGMTAVILAEMHLPGEQALLCCFYASALSLLRIHAHCAGYASATSGTETLPLMMHMGICLQYPLLFQDIWCKRQ